MTAHHASERNTSEHGGGGRWVLWLPGLIVALGAAAATAHGLFEVAVAARVPTPIAWIYPLITDGLAVVAYTATARLTGSARGYAWAVVVLSAGLSGLAQAVFLASDFPTPGDSGNVGRGAGLAVSGALRFGIGAWPAIAAALAAHLLHLLAAAPTAAPTEERSAVQHPPQGSTVTVQQVPLNSSEHRSTRSTDEPAALTAPLPILEPAPEPNAEPGRSDAVVTPFNGRLERPERPGGRGAESPARDRALAAAARLTARTGALPTVSELETEAQVSRGTAAAVLKTLREDDPRPRRGAPPPRTALTAPSPTNTRTPSHDHHRSTAPTQHSPHQRHEHDHSALQQDRQSHRNRLNSDKIKAITPLHHDLQVRAGLRPTRRRAPRARSA